MPVDLAWHGRNTTGEVIVIGDVADSSVLYHFYLIDVFLLPGIPDCCRIF